jgi:hypothetical protein
MAVEIEAYNAKLSPEEQKICKQLMQLINAVLNASSSKIWHGHPVWFINGNPIVGYSKQKPGIRLMFWSGADFEESCLNVRGKKFKDASLFFNESSELNETQIRICLEKSKTIQWDYQNIVKRKGKLERLEV